MASQDRAAQALIVVDMQTAFLSGEAPVPAAKPLLTAVSGLTDAARAAGVFIVQLQNDGEPGSSDEPGTPGWELFFTPDDETGEPVLRKVIVDDGFHDSDLHRMLSDRGIRDVVICGVMPEMCVSATARSAIRLGYRVVLPHDGHATFDIPAAAGLAEAVPAAVVSRLAEWALSLAADIVTHAADVKFEASA